MTTQQLPERPNLEQLKKQAKDLLASARKKNPAALARFRALPALEKKTDPELAALDLALHDAQSVVAREFGFPSWNALRDRVEELTLQFDEAVAAFTRGSLEQRLSRAERLLTRFPNLIADNFHAALAYGDATAVAKHLARDPALATKMSGPHEWAPLLYVAHSHWASKNADGLVAVARLLLAHGASADTSYPLHGNPKEPLPVLWAAACHSRNAGLAQLLLEAGANPNDGESVYHAAENGDIAMLDLLAHHGALADGGQGAEPWGNTPLYFILGHYAGLAHDADVRRGAAWLLAHGANPNRVCYPDKSGETPLHVAARHWDAAMIELLAAHGADLHARRRDGKNALTLAELNGRTSAAAALRARGVAEELQPDEKFLAACMRGDREEALRLRDPKFVAQHAAQFLECGKHAIETMLACGFDIATTGGLGETKLHWAAFHGDAASARLLIAHGAPLDLHDRVHHSPPLGWVDYAENHANNPSGDYASIARALLAAGAAIPPPAELETWGSEVVLDVIAEFRRSRGLTSGATPPAPQTKPATRTRPDASKRFFKAARQGQTTALEELLAAGQDARATDEIMATALHHAAIEGHLACVRVLLAHGAEINARDRQHESTPLGWCFYGSLSRGEAGGDYGGIARALLGAGATFETWFTTDQHVQTLVEWGAPVQMNPASEAVRQAVAESRRS